MENIQTQKAIAAQLLDEGVSIREAAEAVGLSKSAIGRLKAARENATAQEELAMFTDNLNEAKATLAEAKAALATVQSRRGASAIAGIDAIQAWRQEVSQAEADVQDAQDIYDALAAEEWRVRVRYNRRRAEELDAKAEAAEAEHDAHWAKVQALYDQLAELEGDQWRSNPVSAALLRRADMLRQQARSARSAADTREREASTPRVGGYVPGMGQTVQMAR